MMELMNLKKLRIINTNNMLSSFMTPLGYEINTKARNQSSKIITDKQCPSAVQHIVMLHQHMLLESSRGQIPIAIRFKSRFWGFKRFDLSCEDSI